MKLIDKDALVAEIENLENTYKKCPTRNSYEEGLKDGRLIGYKDALHKINTLEVKEVGNIWHDASETPKGAGDKEILVQFTDFHTSVLEIDDWEYLDHQTKWAYLKDLI